MFLKPRRVHFVGLGGIGMSGIAEVLHNLGHAVSGSDARSSDILLRLASLGLRVQIGHAAENVDAAHVVVVSSAVRSTNVEVRAARERGIPVIPRAEMLAELMRLKLGIAIAGAHGKTSTTSMTAKILFDAGLDPTVVNGGRLGILGSSSRLGRGPLLVAEADESDRSFLMLSPVIAVATNLDEEHMESYADMDDMAAAYQTFLDKVPFYGAAILHVGDAYLAAIAGRLKRPVVRFGLDCEADVVARSLKVSGSGTRFEIDQRGRALGAIELPVPGRHNVLNALAAAAVAFELDVPFESVASSLASFEGADRRFQLKGEARGIRVIDDYAHHPTEIRATLAALRAHASGRIVAVFQPHRYSRVSRLRDAFASAFGDADVVCVLEVYAAGEEPLPGCDGASLAAALRSAGQREVVFLDPFDAVPARLGELARAGDVVITLGAGSVTSIGPQLLALLAGGA